MARLGIDEGDNGSRSFPHTPELSVGTINRAYVLVVRVNRSISRWTDIQVVAAMLADFARALPCAIMSSWPQVERTRAVVAVERHEDNFDCERTSVLD